MLSIEKSSLTSPKKFLGSQTVTNDSVAGRARVGPVSVRPGQAGPVSVRPGQAEYRYRYRPRLSTGIGTGPG